MKHLNRRQQKEDAQLLRLDLGAGKGKNTPEGFVPVDKVKAKGITVVDLRKRWPWKAGSVDEVNCQYLLHHLTAAERVHFVNELYRVLKPSGKASIVTPYWCAARAYGDSVVQWPPITEAWYPTLNKTARDGQNFADESGLTCDFEVTMGYGMHPLIVNRNTEYQQHAVGFWKEAAQDLYATLTKRS